MGGSKSQTACSAVTRRMTAAPFTMSALMEAKQRLGSEFFLNPEKAMKPVFARLNELKIRAEGGSSSVEAPQNGKEVLERIVRRAAEYRQHWVTQAKAQLARSGNGVAERARKPARSAKKKRKASARK